MRWILAIAGLLLSAISALAFEPITIDEQTYNNILQSARQNFRVNEYEMLTQMLGNLEQRALNTKPKPEAPTPPEQKK